MLLSTSETDEEEVNPPTIITNQIYENNNIIKNYDAIVLKENVLSHFLCNCYDKENLIDPDNYNNNKIDQSETNPCCCNCSNNIINDNNTSVTYSTFNESVDKINKLDLCQELREIIINSNNNNNINKNYTIKTYESSSSEASVKDLFSPIKKKKKNLKINNKNNKKYHKQHNLTSIIFYKEKINENIFQFNIIDKSKKKKTLIRNTNRSNNNNNNNHSKSSIITTRKSSNYSNSKLIVKEKTIETEIIELTNPQRLNLSKKYKNNLIKKINSLNSNDTSSNIANLSHKNKVKKIDCIENKRPKLNKKKLQLKKIKNNLNLLNVIEQQKTTIENLKKTVNSLNDAAIDLNVNDNSMNLNDNENEKNKSLNQDNNKNLSVRKQFYKLSLSANHQNQNTNLSDNLMPQRTPKRKSGVLTQNHKEKNKKKTNNSDSVLIQYNINSNSAVKKRTRSDNNTNNIKTNDMSVYDYRLTTTQSGDQTGGNSNNNVNNNNNYKTYNQISLLERTTLNDNINNHHNINNNILTSNNHYLSQAHNVSTPSIATLCNIGNTCYLNSVVYTLRFAPLFLHNLHHLIDDITQVNQKIGHNKTKSSSLGRNIGGLQGPSTRSWSSKDLASLGNNVNDVPKSNRQIATEKLHELYQNLHRNEFIDNTEPFHADTFLHSIQDVSSIFEGNQQQDAHEFLMCILDSIRETCLSLTKIIYDYPDIVINGYVSLPEQNESQIQNDKQIQPAQPQQQSILPLKKAFFFSRKSKRKDEKMKNVNKPESPLKDNQIITDLTVQDTMSGTIASNVINNQALLNDDVIDCSGNNIINDEKQNISSIDKDKINEKIKKLGLNFFTEDFEGITVSTTKCLSCETITEQKETMIDISIPISGQENKDALEKPHLFFQNSCITKEYFSGDNKYRCEQCFGYTEAIRSISFEVLPRLLVIQLKRFSGGMEKINSYIPTPFTMDCFCQKCCTLQENEVKPHVYKLYSVITHVGATMSVGHYIAYTCSLDFYTEYINCPKDERKNSLNASTAAVANLSNSLLNNVNGTNDNKNQGIMKKKIFRRSKTSSNSDVTKSLKNLNNIISGNSNKNLLNGGNIINTDNNKITNANLLTCQGLNCCGIHMKTATNSLINNLYNNSVGNNDANEQLAATYSNSGVNTSISMSTGSGASGPGLSNNYIITNDIINHQQTSSSSSSSTSTATNASTNSRTIINNSEQIWYMCDDDKIKIMTQHEFEDLLSPNRKIMITPYLLFYARSDV